jgi:hypothetical protein
MINKPLHVVCFRELTSVFVTKDDIEVTEKRLQTFIQKLLSIKPGDSLFLCEYPLLTRLHVGLILIMTTLFFKVSLLNTNRPVFQDMRIKL